MAWHLKQAILAAKIGSTWGTEVALGANCGIKIDKPILPVGVPNAKIEETIDCSWPDAVDFGNIDNLSLDIPVNPRHVYTNALDPITQMLLSVLYGGGTTIKTQQGASALWLHTGAIASGHALQDDCTKFFTIGQRVLGSAVNSMRSVRSWQPSGFVWESKAGEPVLLTLKGLGDKVVYGSSVNQDTQYNAVTYTEPKNRVHHHHLRGAGDTTDGLWLKMYAASDEGGAQLTNFDQSHCLQSISGCTLTVDRKHDPYFTDAQTTDQPNSNGFNEITVQLRWELMSDWLYQNLEYAIKYWEGNPAASAQNYFMMRSRWTMPQALATTYRGWYEFGLPKLMPTEMKNAGSPGKRYDVDVTFKALRPPSSTHLPNEFLYVGGAAGAAFDAIYLAVANAYASAVYLA